MTGLQYSSDAPFENIERFISRMPSLSTTVMRVLEICNSPTTSPDDLNRVIALDPVLTGQVLKVVNSAYYGLRSKIVSLPRAIIMLGMNTIKNLVISTAVLNSFGTRVSFRALSMEKFWLHSVCAGVTAKQLAVIKAIPVTEREEYFVGGLLHDLGKIPLNSLFPSEYKKILNSLGAEGGSLYKAERESLGIDHMQVGGMIGDKWKLGGMISDCLYHHHDPGNAQEEHRQKVYIIALANMLSKLFEINSVGNLLPDRDAIEYLLTMNGFNDFELDELKKNVLEEIEKAQVFLQLTMKG